MVRVVYLVEMVVHVVALAARPKLASTEEKRPTARNSTLMSDFDNILAPELLDSERLKILLSLSRMKENAVNAVNAVVDKKGDAAQALI